MNRKLTALLLSGMIVFSTMPAMAEDTVPPSVSVPNINTTENIPSLESITGNTNTGGSDTGTNTGGSTGGGTGTTTPTPTTPTPTPTTPPVANETTTKELDAVKEALSNTSGTSDAAALIKAAMEKVGTVTVATTTGSNVKVEAEDLIKQAEQVQAFTASLQSEKLVASDKKIETKVVISVDLKSGSKLDLPSLDAVFEKVDTVEVKTGLGAIVLSKNTLGASATQTSVEMTAADSSKVPSSLKGNKVVELTLQQDDTKVTKFLEPIKVTLPYTPAPGENTDLITAFYLDENGISHAVAGVYKDGFLTFKTNHFSMFYIASNAVAFNDIASDRWSKTFIDSIAAKGLMVGKGESRFDPTGDVTRAEFIAMLANVLKYGEQSVRVPFKDVKTSDWYYAGVQMLYGLGLLDDYSGTLSPNEAISREEMGILIGKVLVYLGYNTSSTDALAVFGDASDLAGEGAQWVATAVEQGILTGAYGYYHPENNMSREQATAVLYKLIQK